MARYIDADALKDRMLNYYGCVNANTSKSNYRGETLMNYEVADMIEDCIDNAPTADVAPKSEVDKWYYEYHCIKDALKQEKDYHRETHKLVDKYFNELQVAKSEVERLEKELVESYKKLDESMDFTCVFGQPHKVSNCPIDDEVAKAKAEVAREIFAEIDNIIQKYVSGDIDGADIVVRLFMLKKKYVEGENDE